MGLKPRQKYIYRGREMDPVDREVEAAEIKDRDATPSKLEKEIGGQPAKIGTYKSMATIKRTTKNI